ncbi:MAG: DUF4476 domain-containing protein [Cytophagales bacterium]|nr:MAG: DUF4476 domain-containing protein [Cytophagales bacterium]
MKKIFFILIYGFLYFPIFAQNNCNQPVSNFAFQGFKRDIQTQNGDNARLNTAKSILNNNCFGANQIKELAELFQDDFSRLDFAKTAYDRTFDKGNFYDVYNSFAYFSTVFMLHDFVLERRGGNSSNNNNNNNNQNNNNQNNPIFPNLLYPNAFGYVGQSRCNNPLSVNNFNLMARDVNVLNGDDAKINKLGEYFAQNICMTTAQIMQFSTLLQNENNRLNYLRRMYARSFDSGNYQQAVQVLSSNANQQNLVAFLQAENNNTPVINPTNPTNTPCLITDADFKDIRDRIAKESFNNARITLARTIISAKRCFNTTQIRNIMTIFSFDNDKINIAKFAYDFCTDKDNYFKLVDAFTFNREKQELMKFIDSKR